MDWPIRFLDILLTFVAGQRATRSVTTPVDREFSLPESASPVRFRGFYISKPGVGTTDYSEVVWSFWHGGSWWPDVASRWKFFRSSPAMFKIQIQRQATGISMESFSCEPLLKEIVRELNTRIERAAKADAPNGLNESTHVSMSERLLAFARSSSPAKLSAGHVRTSGIVAGPESSRSG